MNQKLDVVWFDWKETDELVQFIQDITAAGAKCFRQVVTSDDCYILVYSDRPVSQVEANEFYKKSVIASQAQCRKNNCKG